MSLMVINVIALQIFFLTSFVLGNNYYIAPIPSTPCPEEDHAPCFTLSEYARNSSNFVSNTTLILLPGNHSLVSEISIRGIKFLAIILVNPSTTLNTSITCSQSARFSFMEVDYVSVRGINLIGCVNNYITLVQQFIMEDCSLQGQGSNGTGLELHHVMKASILRSSFASYVGSGKFRLEAYHTVNSRSLRTIGCAKVTITESTFFNNSVNGALLAYKSVVSINTSIFLQNSIHNIVIGFGGGAIFAEYGTLTINGSIFDSNVVVGGGDGGAVCTYSCSITLSHSTFSNNSASESGGAVYMKSFIGPERFCLINSSMFTNNTGKRHGGAMYSNTDSIIISNSIFSKNIVTGDYAAGGALHSSSSQNTIKNTKFTNNSATGGSQYKGIGGAVYFSTRENVVLTQSTFTNNSASGLGGAIYITNANLNTSGFLHIQYNMANYRGAIYVLQSTVYFSGNTTISHNYGSLYAFYTNITFTGLTRIMNNSIPSNISQEGGAMTTVHSKVTFFDIVDLSHNTAIHGGAISATLSKIFINGIVTITHNKADLSGGSIYTYQSVITVNQYGLSMNSNRAVEKGGGIHAISSTIVFTDGSKTYITNNHAERGGGMCIETSSKLHIIKTETEYISFCKNMSEKCIRLEFIRNSAEYGGALYVSDKTSSGTCYSIPYSSESAFPSECFIQHLGLYAFSSKKQQLSAHTRVKPYTSFINVRNTYFLNNSATAFGGILYGGLLDRCTTNPLFNSYLLDPYNTTSFILKITDLSPEDYHSPKSISSDAVRVCFCKDNHPDCSYKPQPIYVKRGETFNVSLAAVDQANNTVANSIIHSSVLRQAKLGEGQSLQRTNIYFTCSNLSYSIISPQNEEQLFFYADGPCMSAGISTANLNVKCVPCPIGFIETDFHCECDPFLSKYIANCSIDKDSVLKNPHTWISYTNYTGYMLYSHCPFDYCKQTPTKINLSATTDSEFHNVQCAYNRSGKLCGQCKDNLSLSIGSSECQDCSGKWWSTLFFLFFFVISGILMVGFLLLFNLTVAVGTINGIIFYSNIFVANRSIFLISEQPHFKFLRAFIALLSFDLGFKSCFVHGLNHYSRSWLQIGFPAYVTFLIAMVVVLSYYSTKFARLLTHKNPVATLATMILLSYSKLLRTIIDLLSFANIEHSNGTRETVWLVDGNVPYLKGKHIPLFIMAIVILVVGLVFSFLLFFWQCLLHCPYRMGFMWIRNTKLNSFMDAYSAPYSPRHRYWTGLLLFTRVFLYLVFSAINISGDPGVNLVSMIVVVMILALYMAILKVYKQWPLFLLELSSLFNLILLSVMALYIRLSGRENDINVPGYVSLSIAFITFLGILIFHAYEYINIVKRCAQKVAKLFPGKRCFHINMHTTPDRRTQRVNVTKFNQLREPLIESEPEVSIENKPHDVMELKDKFGPTFSVVDAPQSEEST